jgi:hypothetical protein
MTWAHGQIKHHSKKLPHLSNSAAFDLDSVTARSAV